MKSVYKYEGLDEQELSFPANVLIRVLRKNIHTKKFDDEQWYEGVYDNKIGFFPKIFVEDLSDWNEEKSELKFEENFADDLNEKTLIQDLDLEKLYVNDVNNNNNNSNSTGSLFNKNESMNVESPFTENQKVPH